LSLHDALPILYNSTSSLSSPGVLWWPISVQIFFTSSKISFSIGSLWFPQRCVQDIKNTHVRVFFCRSLSTVPIALNFVLSLASECYFIYVCSPQRGFSSAG